MYTLVPGGGFIMCENVADIDDNVPMPPMSPEAQAKMVEEHCDTDPVTKTLHKLGDVYTSTIQPLMSMNYTPDDPASVEAATNAVSRAMSVISERALPLVAKLSGLIAINDSVYGYRYCGDKFYAHIGLFMKNMKRIQQEGLMEYSYTVDILPMFNGEWRVRRIINMLAGNPDLLDVYINQEMLATITGYDRDGMEVYDSMIDIMETFFLKTEKLARLERHRDETIYLVTLMESFGDSPTDPAEFRGRTDGGAAITRLASQVIRKTLQEMYNVQNDVLEGKSDVDLSKAIYRTVNLYGIITLHSMYMSYQLRRTCAWASAVNRYTDLLLSTLKTD